MNHHALATTIDHLRTQGVLSDAHEALVCAAESMAEALDNDPGNASLWKVYCETLKSLTALVEGGDDDTEAILIALRSPLRNTTHD